MSSPFGLRAVTHLPIRGGHFGIALQFDGVHRVKVQHRVVLVVHYLGLRQLVEPILLGQVLPPILTTAAFRVVMDLVLDRISHHQRRSEAHFPQPASRLEEYEMRGTSSEMTTACNVKEENDEWIICVRR